MFAREHNHSLKAQIFGDTSVTPHLIDGLQIVDLEHTYFNSKNCNNFNILG
jgi:hypothetical protein